MVARLGGAGLGVVGAGLLGGFVRFARLVTLVVGLLALALRRWLLLLHHRLLGPQLGLLAGLAQLGDEDVGVELRRGRDHDLVAPGIDVASVHAVYILEHFLHLLLASFTVNGHPQHQNLKQDIRHTN
uniref:Uncharacterized protein n=1 Tax=Arundo donax TaxID=35708 RepID=A0A0A9EZC3_ARUDO